jgi:hypothetical protein
LEIVAAEPAGDADRLAEGVEAGGGDSSDRDFGLGEALLPSGTVR